MMAPAPITAEQRAILRTLVKAVRTSPQHENIFRRAGFFVRHPAITEECLLYDGDYIPMRDAGVIRALPGGTLDGPFLFTVTDAGFADIDAALREEGQEAVRTVLAIDEEKARAEIRQQITRGKAALESLAAAQETAAWTLAEDERVKWRDYTIRMLEHLFSDATQSRDFRDTTSQTVIEASASQVRERTRGAVERGVRFLESLDESLHFYVPPTPATTTTATSSSPSSRKVFVVHGHDTDALNRVDLFLRQVDLEPVIIMYLAGGGLTIVEQIERHADVPYAIVILTPDDIGYRAGHPKEAKGRARQNVILELGYFMGRIKRANVCALVKGDVETPSDYDGVIYVPMDDGGAWRFKLAQNMNKAGIVVDTGRIAV